MRSRGDGERWGDKWEGDGERDRQGQGGRRDREMGELEGERRKKEVVEREGARDGEMAELGR